MKIPQFQPAKLPYLAFVVAFAAGFSLLLISSLAIIYEFREKLLSITVIEFCIFISYLTLILSFITIIFLAKKTAKQQKKIQQIENEKFTTVELLNEKLMFSLNTAQIAEWDLNLNTLTAQRAPLHNQIFGYSTSLEEWTYDLFLNHVHSDDRKFVDQLFQEAVSKNSTWEVECRIFPINDINFSWIWVRGKVFHIGDTPHMIGLVQDITQQKILEEALLDKEEKLRLLIDNARDYAIFMLDPKGTVTSWHAGAELMQGYSVNEIIGRNFSCFYTEKSIQNHQPENALASAKDSGRYENEGWYVRKNGKWFWGNVIITSIFNKKRELIGYCNITHDLTKQHDIQEKLQNTMNKLTKSNQDLEQFAYIASHDLKAPLRAINSLSLWIEQDHLNKISDESTENLALLRQRVKRMNNLIEGILQYSRATSTLEISTVSLKNLFNEIIELINPPKTFIIHIPETLPTIQTSKVQLSQIFNNLISNAIKYHDRPDGHITLGVKDMDSFYEFSVADDGPGIAPEYHSVIFEMFQTLQARDKIESTGIGLAIVKKIIESQGGHITVDSNIKKGATFLFSWPKQLQPTNNNGDTLTTTINN